MKVHLIKEKTIRDYIVGNRGSKASFQEWLSKVKLADWTTTEDIVQTFPSADFLGNSSFRTIFDIAGNKYRMICKYSFGSTSMRLYVCWIGTHAEYDKICKQNKQYTVFDY
ncbi:MAG TPA: type II toxin-antitoxin system HigB family toxin [Niabella sp.]|uniref:type II toxin-antitoxin system HigB family toxin n=1 Tax=Agriterribacter sp. TaxID=2821509 RepID=UPI002CF7E817|nr:type II toxin-antitoxin system HigB family toxin [Agriterribacter sp.]HRO86303.1 type II toxin-antitoxin system HigB family toxin [Niabella sp.]HRP58298.1 type II toxin-antitoxin system HigB family toxin [Agriterribacter sp.]